MFSRALFLGSFILLGQSDAIAKGRMPPRAVNVDEQSLKNSAELDRIQKAAFRYFLEQRDTNTGLVYNTTEPNSPASPTACGVALSAIPVGIERGWVSSDEGYHWALKLLQRLSANEHVHGFFYHFIDPSSGKRVWQSEVSCIDSAILFAGAVVVARYFAGTEVERLANTLIERADWRFFLNGEDRLYWGWKPESGFEGGPMDFSESIAAYLIALGSSIHPIPADCWDAIRRPAARIPGAADIVYTQDGSLFAYQLPLVWFDLRDKHDSYLDYWTNAKNAILSNIRFCNNHRKQFVTYKAGLWGLSAAIGPDGYKAYGASPAINPLHDGTIAPYAVASSIPWFTDMSLSTLSRMGKLWPNIWTRYGFGDSLNLDRSFACPHTIALDQGMVLLMIENARTGLVWKLFMEHPLAKRAMAAAHFVSGSLDAPLAPAVVPGNPGASIVVPMMDHAVTVDANLSEWIGRESLELTPTNRHNVEFGFIRDPRDAHVLAYVGAGADTFYVAGIITDDEVIARFKDDQIYKDDCIELFWDINGDGFKFDGNPNDVQIGFSPGGPDGKPQLWAWGAIKQRPAGAELAIKRDKDKIIFELGIPMKFLPTLSSSRSARFGLAYHDRDHDGKEAKLQWSIDSSSVPGTIFFGRVSLKDALKWSP